MTQREKDLWSINLDLLKSSVNRYGLYGVMIAIFTITASAMLVSYQMTGQVNLYTIFQAHQENFALRILDFLPFIFAYWGQYSGKEIVSQAGRMMLEHTEDLREENTSWKNKSLHKETHDTLTNLPNRVLFYEKLQDAINASKQNNTHISVVFMDLDNFKFINEQFGNSNGDLILKYFATRLCHQVSKKEQIARMGGDEFAIIVYDDAEGRATSAIIKRIKKLLESTFEIDEKHIEISASMGISCYPKHGKDADNLIQYAEIAMYSAKQNPKGYMFYSNALRQDNPHRLSLLSELRQTINHGGLDLYFQPKININTKKTIAVEVLVRWSHPKYGNISPEEFIPLAERSRLIRPMTDWVILQSLKRLKAWHTAGIKIEMSINISAKDLEDPAFLKILTKAVNSSGVNPAALTIEITESCVMQDPDKSMSILHSMKEIGVNLSIDDFGTGYSSLAYLSHLPVNELKIDKSFVKGMLENANNLLIVNATIDLGHNLNLKVTAEGIEDDLTFNKLAEMGCDIAQGYYMSPPLPENKLIEWLSESKWSIQTLESPIHNYA